MEQLVPEIHTPKVQSPKLKATDDLDNISLDYLLENL
jgi:hypothetical protein